MDFPPAKRNLVLHLDTLAVLLCPTWNMAATEPYQGLPFTVTHPLWGTIYFFIYDCLCVPCMWCPQRPEEASDTLGIWIYTG